jgi:DNA-nicking Smr family endonuclease
MPKIPVQNDESWLEIARTVKPLKQTQQRISYVKDVKQSFKIKYHSQNDSEYYHKVLDLHGMTVHSAYHAVDAFIQQAFHHGLRFVDIITGKGNPQTGTGILKREVPLWLEKPHFQAMLTKVEVIPASRGGVYRITLRRKNY